MCQRSAADALGHVCRCAAQRTAISTQCAELEPRVRLLCAQGSVELAAGTHASYGARRTGVRRAYGAEMSVSVPDCDSETS